MIIAFVDKKPCPIVEGIQKAGKNPAAELVVVDIDYETIILSANSVSIYQEACQSSSQPSFDHPDKRAG